MKEMRRIFALLLCVAMVIGMLPVTAVAADTLVDAAIFCSDVHGSTSAVKNVFTQIADSGVTYSTANFVGDTQTYASSVTEAAQTALGNSALVCNYSYGSHDSEGDYGIADTTGILYNGENYVVYAISQSDMENSTKASAAATAFSTDLAAVDTAKPVFILSHMPLHQRRNDNYGASAWFSAINTEAQKRDIVFFWGHNHTGESSADQEAYYLAKGDSITLQGGTTGTLSFTYMNAGYIGKSAGRGGYATTVQIYDDSMVFQDYNSSGAVDSDYAHNVTVERSFAASEPVWNLLAMTVDGTTVYTVGDELTFSAITVSYRVEGDDTIYYYYPQLSECAVTGTYDMDAVGTYQVSVSWTYEDQTVSNTYSFDVCTPEEIVGGDITVDVSSLIIDSITVTESANAHVAGLMTELGVENYTAYDITPSGAGLKAGNYATVTVPAQGIENPGVYYVSDDGQTVEKMTVTVNEDGTVSFRTNHFSTWVVGETDSAGTDSDSTTGNSVWVEGASGTTTAYVYTATFTEDSAYMLVSNGYALYNNNGRISATAVTVIDDVVTVDDGTVDIADLLWTINSSGDLINDGYYLLRASGKNATALTIATSDSGDAYSNWTYADDTLTVVGGSGGSTTYYAYYNTSSSAFYTYPSTSQELKFYGADEVTTSTSGTYTLAAQDVTVISAADATTTVALTGEITFLADGEETSTTVTDLDGTYTYEIVEDTAGVLASVSADGTVTVNANAEGTATVAVTYTFMVGEESYSITDNVTVTVTGPYYSLELHKAALTVADITEFADGVTYYTYNSTTGTYQVADAYVAGVTYYTTPVIQGELITSIVALKGIGTGDQYSLWAVIKEHNATYPDGEDVGDVEDSQLKWTVSDTSIATIDPETGLLTFTGNAYGTITVTAFYTDEDGNVLCSDAVTISVTESLYVVPTDGTNDFPEYPNQGSIRYDKNAVAVGNFSETGIAKVELSMTGVPYTTGSEIDVVIMMDMTGSMTTESMAAAEAAAKNFADQIILNTDKSYNSNRISVQVFSVNGVTELWPLSAVTEDTYSALVAAIESASDKRVGGGTPYSTALKSCYATLYAASKAEDYDRGQYCVFVSDGTPTTVTYITDSTTPTETETVSVTVDDTTYTQTVPAYTTGTNASTFESTGNTYHEYWSQLMINNDVTVYGVYTSAAAGNSSSGGGDVNDTTVGVACMTKVASSSSHVYTVADYTDTSALNKVFDDIAQKILQAATDVVVADEITPQYTMIFDIPKGHTEIDGVIPDGQEFYIEVTEYTLTPVYDTTDTTKIVDYVRGTSTSKCKLYLGVSDGTYYAASDASGAAYDSPVFAATTLGEKGTHYYWSTDASKGDQGISVTVDGTAYYFVSNGSGEYNMTSGAYAYGTVSSETNTSTDLIIATPYFVYNASTRMIVWTAEKLDSTELALSYFLYLDSSATEVGQEGEVDPATYPTNVGATITYTNHLKVRCQQEFPVPQMTWKGAQVSYVFYLVNGNGDPVNRAGRVIPFSEAVYVTQTYTKSVVWNDEGTITSLNAAQLAEELVPDVYELYDLKAYYEINVYMTTTETERDHFIIEGSALGTVQSNEVTVKNTETTKVFNTKADADHRYTTYGAYSNVAGTYTSTNSSTAYTATLVTDFDYSNTTVAFAVVWKPELVPDTVVIDFGLPVVIDVAANDALAAGVTGVRADAPAGITINKGTYTADDVASAAIELNGVTIGTAAVENNTSVRFTLDTGNGMQMNDAVMFYYESSVDYYKDGELTNDDMYSSVTVIPATTIYYEDSYLDYTVNDFSTGNVIWKASTADSTATYDRTWITEGTTNSSATQAADRPGTNTIMSDVYDADNNYGYDSAYDACSTFSLGSASKITVDARYYGEALFSFYGTGFDVVSMTDSTTGSILVTVTDEGGDEVRSLLVDTYYGYTYDEANDKWVVTDTTDNAIYQVPVITVEGLSYGKYNVAVRAFYNSFLDNTGAGKYCFYMDAIRIYDPANDGADNADIEGAYTDDGEGWPVYFEVRDNVIEAATVGDSGVEVNGIVYMDGVGKSALVSDYANYGPNNELYLMPGQAIAFNLDLSAYESLDAVFMGIKCASDTAASYKIFDGAAVANQKQLDALAANELTTATDMYYEITDLKDATIVVYNSGTSGILSLTNVKLTFTADPGVVENLFYVNSDVISKIINNINTTVFAPASLVVDVPASVTAGNTITVTVTTGTDVAAVEINGELINTYSTSGDNRIWTGKVATASSVTEDTVQDISVVAYNADGLASEATTEQVTVNSAVSTIRKIIKTLFGWLFG